jgi:hypothetical protein
MVTSENEIRIFFVSIVERRNNKYSCADVQYFTLVEKQLLHQRSKNYDNDCLCAAWNATKGHFVVDKNDFHSGSIYAYILREGSSALLDGLQSSVP